MGWTMWCSPPGGCWTLRHSVEEGVWGPVVQLTWLASVEPEGAEPVERVLHNGNVHCLRAGANVK